MNNALEHQVSLWILFCNILLSLNELFTVISKIKVERAGLVDRVAIKQLCLEWELARIKLIYFTVLRYID